MQRDIGLQLAGTGLKGRSLLASSRWWVAPLILFLLVAFVYPVAQLLALSVLNKQGQLTLDHFTRFFVTPVYLQVLVITLKVAFWTTLLCVLVGYPVAYLLARVSPNTRSALVLWILMPFWTSFLVRTFAWVVLLGRNGAINTELRALGIVDEPLELIYSFAGVMIGTTHALLPMAVLTMLGAMQTIDHNLTKAAGTLGARPSQAFWRVWFPLSAPGVAASALLVFAVALGFFITPILLGSRKETMIAQLILFQVEEVLNWHFAAAMSLVLLALTLALFYLYDRAVGISALAGERRDEAGAKLGLFGQLAGRWSARLFNALGELSARAGAAKDQLLGPRLAAGPRWLSPLWWFSIAAIIFLVVPTFFLVPVSFSTGEFIEWPPRGFSLRWYEEYFGSSVWRSATLRSIWVAIATAVASLALGIPAALALSRPGLPARSAILALIVSPLILPHIIVAIGLFYVYARVGLVGTSIGLVIGHTVFAVPYVVITMMAAMKHYDQRLDHAAWSLGATRLQTVWKITLPVLRAGVLAAFVFAFVRSFDELTVALFISTGEATTLPKQMWSDALLKINPTLAAVSTCLLVFITLTILAAEYLNRRR